MHLATISHRRPSFLGGMARVLDLGATLHSPPRLRIGIKREKRDRHVACCGSIHMQSARIQTRSIAEAWNESLRYLDQRASRNISDTPCEPSEG